MRKKNILRNHSCAIFWGAVFYIILLSHTCIENFKNDVTKSLDNSTYHVSKKNYS